MRFTVWTLALAAAGLLTGCRQREARSMAASDPPPVSATVMAVTPEPFPLRVPITGTLVSRVRVDVKAEVIGHIARFDKQEGDPVTAGEPVVWVDDENSRLALSQAETGVRVAEAALDRAHLLEGHSRSELDRAQHLVESGGITDKDLKTAQLGGRDATAQVDVAKAQLEQARAALDVAQKKLRDTVIRAPISGEIQKKLLNPGSYVEAPTQVFTIVDNRRLELESPVPAVDLGSLRAGQAVSFRVASYPQVTFNGRLLDVNPAVEEQTRTAKVRIQVDNSSGRLKAGMFAEGDIVIGIVPAAILIPAAAVYRDDRAAKFSYVFVVEDGKACRRSVRIGHERDSRLEIVGGLSAGDRLIAEQSIEIAEGVRVEPRK